MTTVATNGVNGGVETTYSWWLGQKEYRITRAPRPLATLRFDPKNQRIQFALRVRGLDPRKVDQNTIEEVLNGEERDHINRLYAQIKDVGGLLEPLLVTHDGEIIEGNCRFAALRRLCRDYEGDAVFCFPPCETAPPEFDDEPRLLFLGDCHVSGKQQWDAYEKAEHVYNLINRLNKTREFVATNLRMSKPMVIKYLKAYTMHTEYLGETPQPGDILKWSYFLEFWKKKQLCQRLEEDPSFKDRFFAWIRDGRLKRGEQVRKLPDLLDDEDALKALDDYGFGAAVDKHEKKVEANNVGSFVALEQAIAELERLPFGEMVKLRDPNAPGAARLRDLHQRIQAVAKMAGISLNGKEE